MAGYFELPEDFNVHDFVGHNIYQPSDDWDFAEREEMEHGDLPSVIAYNLNKRKPR